MEEIKQWTGFKKENVPTEESKPKNTKEYLKSKAFVLFKKDLFSYAKFIIINGIFLNYAASIILGMPFEYWTFPGYGIAWLYLKEEIPRIINGLYWRANK